MTFGAYLRAARTDAGLSLRALAARVGVSAPYLHDVEAGRRGPVAVARWPALAKALGVTEGRIEMAARAERCPTCGGPRRQS